MRDNDLIRLIRPLIIENLEDFGFLNVDVVQAYQPTQQGVRTNPTVYFFKASEKRIGHVQYIDVWDDMLQQMLHKEKQWYETTLQFQAFAIQDPVNTNNFTAADLINFVIAVLQSMKIVDFLAENEVGIYHVSDIQNPFFIDDKDRFEFSPSFQAIFTHTQLLQRVVPVIKNIETGIYRV